MARPSVVGCGLIFECSGLVWVGILRWWMVTVRFSMWVRIGGVSGV